MPTSITKYSTFDGKEFDDEEDAKAHEEQVRGCGALFRTNFLNGANGQDYLPFIEPKLVELVKSYSDDDAWLIMRSLHRVGIQLENNNFGLPDESWLYADPFED